MSGNIDIITINTAEYKELMAKALKYDQLYKAAEENKYLSDFERAIYGIARPEPEKKESEEKANETV